MPGKPQSFPEVFGEFSFFRGRVALSAILRALGVSSGAEVAVQAFTCIAVPEAVLACGAKPVYVDVEENGINMAAGDLKRKITKATRAIVVQHTFGIPADMAGIMRVADELDLPVVEDCCHTYASTYDGKKVGTFGRAAFYSFEWGKPVVAGLGGSAVVNDRELKKEVSKLYNGFARPPLKAEHSVNLQYAAFKFLYRPSVYWAIKRSFHLFSRLGFTKGNYNMVSTDTKIAPEFGWKMPDSLKKRMLRKIPGVARIAQHSNRLADYYREQIKHPAFTRVSAPANSAAVYARYPLFAAHKDRLLAAASAAGIEISGWYQTPVHPLAGNELREVNYAGGSCPNAEKAASLLVSLPVNEKTSLADAGKITRFINTWE